MRSGVRKVHLEMQLKDEAVNHLLHNLHEIQSRRHVDVSCSLFITHTHTHTHTHTLEPPRASPCIRVINLRALGSQFRQLS